MPDLEFAFITHVDVAEVMDIGPTVRGHRRIVPILGGTFEGPRVKGTVLPGADWQLVRPDGVLELEAKYALRTDDGVLISIVNRCIRRASPEVMAKLNAGRPVDPGEVYFRTTPTFETADAKYAWMMNSIFLGTGERKANQVIINFFEVL
ncbi:MAG: DUF3237 domain-containing protein [Dehalococcoidia bacterium]